MQRREFVLGSGAMLALSGIPQRVIGQAALKVPMVDSLIVTVLTDSSYDTPRTTAHKLVRVRRKPFTVAPSLKTLHSEWGLATALESRIGSEIRTMMLDYGYTPEALLNNIDFIGLDATKTQALILSHGHYDHLGGLIGFLQKYRSRLPANLTLYVGGEDNFCQRKTGSGTPGHFADWGVLDRRELEKLNVKIVTCERPTVIEGHAFTTGNIPRSSFEKVFPNTLVSYHKNADGAGCNMPAADAKAKGEFVPDEHLDEHATCFNVRDRGPVVISSCGHAGIVNSVRQAVAVSRATQVHAQM